MSNPINFNLNSYCRKMEEGFSMFGPGYWQNPGHGSIENPSDTVDINDKEKKHKPLGKIVAGTMLAIGAVVLLFTKGFSGATAKQITRFFNYLEIKKLTSTNKAVQLTDQIIEKTGKKVRKGMELGNSIANFTAIKDSFVREFTTGKLFGLSDILKRRFPGLANLKKTHPKIWGILKFPQAVCDWTTKNVFRMTKSAVDKNYTQIGASLDTLEATMQAVLRNKDIHIPEVKKSEIMNLVSELSPMFKRNFGQNARNIRFENMEKGLGNLGDEVRTDLAKPVKRTIKALWEYITTGKPIKDSLKESAKETGETFSSYITQKRAEPVISEIQKALEKAKMDLSYNIEDVVEKLMNHSTDLKNLIRPEDIQTRKLLADLFKDIENFSTLKGSAERKAREKAIPKFLSILESIRTKAVSPNLMGKNGGSLYSQKEIDEIFSKLDYIKETLDGSTQMGKIQEILSLLKPYCGGSKTKEYQILKAAADKFNRELNKGIGLEGTDMPSKYAETRVGSITTDMMGLAMMAGGGVWAVSKGKNKEEKVGATLKVGVPLIGAIGMYFIAGAKAISGVKNLALSIGTGYALRKIGESIFNYYKKRYVENKSVQEIAKETFDEATSQN